MPTYEFRCPKCQAKLAIVSRRYEQPAVPKCECCGNPEMGRVYSPVAYHRSEGSRLAEFDGSKPRGLSDYRDSRNVGLWAKNRARELGMDGESLANLDEVVDKARDEVLSGGVGQGLTDD